MTKSEQLQKAIIEFKKINKHEPTHIALSLADYMTLSAERYLPGIRTVSISQFKKRGSVFMGIPVIWKEGVLV